MVMIRSGKMKTKIKVDLTGGGKLDKPVPLTWLQSVAETVVCRECGGNTKAQANCEFCGERP